jgi:hypothetical protein
VQFLSKLLFPIRHRFAALHTIFEGRRLFDKLRAGGVLVVRWVDRSARIYEDVCDPICEFMRRGVRNPHGHKKPHVRRRYATLPGRSRL